MRRCGTEIPSRKSPELIWNKMRVWVFLLLTLSSLRGQDLTNEWNSLLPRWLRFSGEYRARVEGYDNILFRPEVSDAYLLNRIRLTAVIRPTDWLKFSFQAQDARIYWNQRIA